jgi:hypothetical protein
MYQNWIRLRCCNVFFYGTYAIVLLRAWVQFSIFYEKREKAKLNPGPQKNYNISAVKTNYNTQAKFMNWVSTNVK